MSNCNIYYYAGQFGYFNVILLPLLNKYSGQQLTIYTYPDYCYILNNLFPGKFIIISIPFNSLRIGNNTNDNIPIKSICPSIENLYTYLDLSDDVNNLDTYNPCELSTTINLNTDLTNHSIYGVTTFNNTNITTVISNILLKSADNNVPNISSCYNDPLNNITIQSALVINNNIIGTFFYTNLFTWTNYFDFTINRLNNTFKNDNSFINSSFDIKNNININSFNINGYKNGILYESNINSFINIGQNMIYESNYLNTNSNYFLDSSRNILISSYDYNLNIVKDYFLINQNKSFYYLNINNNIIKSSFSINNNIITNILTINNTSLTNLYYIDTNLLNTDFNGSSLVEFYDINNNLIDFSFNVNVNKLIYLIKLDTYIITNTLLINGNNFVDVSGSSILVDNSGNLLASDMNIFGNPNLIKNTININGDEINSAYKFNLSYAFNSYFNFNGTTYLNNSINICNSYFYVDSNQIINYFDNYQFNFTDFNNNNLFNYDVNNTFYINNNIISNDFNDGSGNYINYNYDLNQNIITSNFLILGNNINSTYNILLLRSNTTFNTPLDISGQNSFEFNGNVFINSMNQNTINNIYDINQNTINSNIIINSEIINIEIKIINTIEYEALTELVQIWEMSNFDRITSPITTTFQDSNTNYICYFPRFRNSGTIPTDWTLRNATTNQVQYILRLYKPKYKVFIIGSETLTYNYGFFNAIQITDLEQTIYYLKNCKFLISNDSGYVDFAKNCGCQKILILEPINLYHSQFNPFNCTQIIINNLSDLTNF